MDSGPYEVEFKGEQHCLRVPAVLLNSCVIQVHAPGTVHISSSLVLFWTDPLLLDQRLLGKGPCLDTDPAA